MTVPLQNTCRWLIVDFVSFPFCVHDEALQSPPLMKLAFFGCGHEPARETRLEKSQEPGFETLESECLVVEHLCFVGTCVWLASNDLHHVTFH